jgi:hypothetical protein
MKSIKCDRSQLEKSVLKVLIDPKATEDQIKDAIHSLDPQGKLKLVTGNKEKTPKASVR